MEIWVTMCPVTLPVQGIMIMIIDHLKVHFQENKQTVEFLNIKPPSRTNIITLILSPVLIIALPNNLGFDNKGNKTDSWDKYGLNTKE